VWYEKGEGQFNLNICDFKQCKTKIWNNDQSILGKEEFRCLSHLGILQLKKINLMNVPLEHRALNSFMEFIDGDVQFEKLSVTLKSKGFFNERIHKVIRKAQKKVVIVVDSLYENIHPILSAGDMLSIERPVEFQMVRKGTVAIRAEVLEQLFRNGHRFHDTFVPIPR
ncbi:hypothetical protein PMAYCL1PPCAC_14121, partial [Pristionchus mayeri]